MKILFIIISDFLISKKHTIAAISWTKPKELIKNWFTVIIFTMFFTAALFGVDMLISYILKIYRFFNFFFIYFIFLFKEPLCPIRKPTCILS